MTRFWIWLVYLILFGFSIPWYLPEKNSIPIWFGLPYWVLISLSCLFAVAIFTVFVIHQYWPEKHTDDMDPGTF